MVILFAVVAGSACGCAVGLVAVVLRLMRERGRLFDIIDLTKADLAKERAARSAQFKRDDKRKDEFRAMIATLRNVLREHEIEDPTAPKIPVLPLHAGLAPIQQPGRVGDGTGDFRTKGGPAPKDLDKQEGSNEQERQDEQETQDDEDFAMDRYDDKGVWLGDQAGPKGGGP